MRLLILFLSALPLFADTVISASWSTGCGDSGSVVTTSGHFGHAESTPCGSSVSASVDASGSSIFAEAFMNGIDLEVSIDAFSTASVDVPEPGLYTLSFAIWGQLVNTSVDFSVIGEGLDGDWEASGSHFWQSGPNETFTTAPVMLEEGPYLYTTHLRSGLGGRLGPADISFSEHFNGLQPVATAVPEAGQLHSLGVCIGRANVAAT